MSFDDFRLSYFQTNPDRFVLMLHGTESERPECKTDSIWDDKKWKSERDVYN